MNFQADTMSGPMHKIPAIFFPENATRTVINIGDMNIFLNHGQSSIMSIFNYLISIFLPVCQFPKSNGTSFIGTISFIRNTKINDNKISFFYFSICRLGMGRSFQRTNIFPRLTVFQNIQAALIAHRGESLNFFKPVDSFFREETQDLLERVGLKDFAATVGGSLSYGFQKQLELGIALASDPELLLLDEPTAGMSAKETHQTIQLVGRITREKGLTLLFTEHDMEVVFSISERILVLHQGRLIAEGSPEEVRNNYDVRKVYLGEAR